jgi:hypothetical protein
MKDQPILNAVIVADVDIILAEKYFTIARTIKRVYKRKLGEKSDDTRTELALSA